MHSMDDESKIVEVTLFGGKVLVTFADGEIALLEHRQIRQLAIESNALTSQSNEETIPS
jgi:hypothetical protein